RPVVPVAVLVPGRVLRPGAVGQLWAGRASAAAGGGGGFAGGAQRRGVDRLLGVDQRPQRPRLGQGAIQLRAVGLLHQQLSESLRRFASSRCGRRAPPSLVRIPRMVWLFVGAAVAGVLGAVGWRVRRRGLDRWAVPYLLRSFNRRLPRD